MKTVNCQMPKISDIFEFLLGKIAFSSVDLEQSFLQLLIPFQENTTVT